MVNLIMEKIENYSAPCSNMTYKEFAPKSDSVKSENKTPEQKSGAAGKVVLPLSLIAGGGILLYLGLKNPGKAKIYKDLVRSRISGMEVQMSDYIGFVKNIIESSFITTSKHIEDYTAQRLINPTEALAHIKRLRDSKSLLDTQEMLFKSVDCNDAEFSRVGASDIGEFASKISNIKSNVLRQIDQKKESSKLVYDDLAHLPPVKDVKDEVFAQNAKDELAAMTRALARDMETVKNERLNSVIKIQCFQMANVITKARNLRAQAKENIINTVFARVRKLLHLPDSFVPSYYKIPDTANFEKLSAAELKPKAVPVELKDVIDNVYLDAVANRDFSKLNDEDLKEIFYTASYNNSLKDLGFLIDRMRIRQAVSAAQTVKKEDAYSVLIAKLEYLSNKLHKFGEDELLARCKKDFDDMNIEQRRAALYYVHTVSRRLGFDSIEEMDHYYSKNNPEYQKLNIREYMNIFKTNADLYFY